MHLLATITAPAYDTWKAAFDAHSEDRDQAGLTLLQLWRDSDDAGRITALFEIADRKRAEDWLKRQPALTGATVASAQFLRTA